MPIRPLLFAALLATVLPARAAPIAPIAALDVPRYMGTWYEIAKYPNRFQKDCAALPAPPTPWNPTRPCRS
jgi:lipocalin